jgi:hypothetical protein
VRVVVVFVLVLLNASLLLWQFYRPQAQAQSSPATDPGVPELALVTVGPAHGDAASCRALGPYGDAEAAQAASKRLRGFGLKPRTQSESRREQWFQVLLGPLPSVDAAQALVTELRSKGINDVQVLPADSGGSSVSLGLFRDRAAAERRTAQLADVGRQARIEPLERSIEVYWVSLNAQSAASLSPAQLGAAGAGKSGVALTPRPCP